MLHISEFRVQKYADKGGFPLSLKLYIVYALVTGFTCANKIQDNELTACY